MEFFFKGHFLYGLMTMYYQVNSSSADIGEAVRTTMLEF